MWKLITVLLALAILGLLGFQFGYTNAQLPSAPSDKQLWISGYYVDGTLSMSDIPWSKLTHAIHSSLVPSDSDGNLKGIPELNADAFTSAAHAAGVKALVSVGGDSRFSESISNNLSGFVSALADFVTTHDYDGIDLDWESGKYTTNPDQINYINIIRALRIALGPSKIISISVYWGNGLETVVQSTHTNLDQVNLMCYDMDQSLTHTHYNHGMYRLQGETQGACAAEGAHFANYVPAAKIGLGIPFYGRIWSGCSDQSCSDGLHDPMQPWFGTPKQTTIPYRDLIATPYWSHPHSWDSVRGASYISINQPGAVNDRFISFTGDQQINRIVQLAKSQGYGGVMEFELEYDFVPSESADARHPLAAAAYDAVFGSDTTQ